MDHTHQRGKEVLGLNSGVFSNSSASNPLDSISNVQDFPFFDSFAALGEISSLVTFQSFSTLDGMNRGSFPGGSNASLDDLIHNDSFGQLTQSSLQNLQLFLADVEHTNGSAAAAQTLPSTTQPLPHHPNHQAQPLPAAATNAIPLLPKSSASTSSFIHQAQTAASNAPSQPHCGSPPAPHPWGWRQTSVPAQKPVPAAIPQEFSNTLHSLASTLPPPVVLANDSVLGSVGGGLHFQRHLVRRRIPDNISSADNSNMFLN
jgi:hypothetical protein